MAQPSERKAIWKFSLLILPVVILLIIALPTKRLAHDVEGKFLLITLIFTLLIIKSEREKRKMPSLTLFLNHVQSALLAIIGMFLIFGFTFLLDYWLVGLLGRNNSYSALGFGLLTASANFLLIRRNPGSVQYVPYILCLPMLVAALAGDFHPLFIPGIVLTIFTSFLGYHWGKKRIIRHGNSPSGHGQ